MYLYKSLTNQALYKSLTNQALYKSLTNQSLYITDNYGVQYPIITITFV